MTFGKISVLTVQILEDKMVKTNQIYELRQSESRVIIGKVHSNGKVDIFSTSPIFRILFTVYLGNYVPENWKLISEDEE